MNRLANLIEENMHELAMLEVLDNGKPYAEAINLDLPLSIQCYRYYAGWADKISGTVINPSGPVAKGNFGYLEKEAVGVVGQIIPWNCERAKRERSAPGGTGQPSNRHARTTKSKYKRKTDN